MVTDTGQGMTSDDLAHIFDEFYRAECPETGHVEGTGLGLAITHQFSRLLGGDITARSQLGVGSTFTIALPMSMGVSDDSAIANTEGAVAVTG